MESKGMVTKFEMFIFMGRLGKIGERGNNEVD